MQTNRFYRSVWRWHFYAGLFAAPILFALAVTGSIYLFREEINDVLYPNLRFTSVTAERAPVSRIAEAAASAIPGGRVARIDTPSEPDRTFEVFVDPPAGEQVRVFVDPRTAEVLGQYVYGSTLVGFANIFHGSLMLGKAGDAVVELAACWGFILAATGLYLWWPRGGVSFARALVPQAQARGRRFWKSVHASLGAWTALLMMFLIITGLPWAGVWGGLFRAGIEKAGLGYPSRNFVSQQTSAKTVADVAQGAAPWTVNGMPAPVSNGHEHAHQAATGDARTAEPAPNSISLDRVAEIVAANGLADPYRLILPAGPTGTYSAFVYPNQPEGQRALYIDQFSGKILGDVRFAQYGLGGKAIELGVQIHMGNYFGRLNQLVMLIACLGVMMLTITGPYMWWLRRPKGAFGAPQATMPATVPTLALLICGLALVFPLAGASLLTVLALDWVISRVWLRLPQPG